MSRKVTVNVEDYAPLREGAECLLFVFHIEKKGRPRRIEVTLRNLDPEHDGRLHTLVLPLPVRPAGKTAAFFRAAGQDVAIGNTIAIHDLIGKTIKGTVGSSPAGEADFVSFSALVKEVEHAGQPRLPGTGGA